MNVKLGRQISSIVRSALLLGFVTPRVIHAQAQNPSDSSSSSSSSSQSTTKKSKKSGQTTGSAANPASTTAPSSGAPSITHETSTADTKSAPSTRSGAVAQTPPSTGMVWVNTSSKVYHRQGSRYYGKTKSGKWMNEGDAVKAGYRAASN